MLRKTERRVTEIFDGARLALRETDVSKREELLNSMAVSSLPKEFFGATGASGCGTAGAGEQVSKQALRLILQRGVREEEVEAARALPVSEIALLTGNRNTRQRLLINETTQLLIAP